jgi:DDE superfamily endonuclease
VAGDFSSKWNFPHCIGALDGKHIAICPPPNSGSLYHNYKQFFSIVLLAVVDANYKFIYVDVGQYGRVSDGGVFNNSSLYEAMQRNILQIPQPTAIEGTDVVVPYVFVADDAFALKPNIMKPYAFRQCSSAKRVFNYRLSRARRMVESAFGILSSRFRVFKTTVQLNPEKVQNVVTAACCLHNFLLRNEEASTRYVGNEATETNDKVSCSMTAISRDNGNRTTNNALNVRDNFCAYFNSDEGSVSWQINSSS